MLHLIGVSFIVSVLTFNPGDGVLSIGLFATTDKALVLLVTLPEKALLCLLSWLESDPSKLGTLRIVAVLPNTCFETAFAGPCMLFMALVVAGSSVLVPGGASGSKEGLVTGSATA